MQPNWTRGHLIGRGSSATVSAAANQFSGEIFAVKSTELSNSEPLQREQNFLSSLSHPNIVNYKGFDITTENQNHKLVCNYNLHLEYMPNTLHDTIKKSVHTFDESRIRYYTKQVLHGLEYLHAKGIVHCDIKSKNILVSENGVKIADFGCSKLVYETKPIGGTPLFMAPEVARGEEQGCACDIWALGCMIIEMGTNSGSPWPKADDPTAVLYKIAWSDEVPEIPGCLSEEAHDFVGKCLMRDHRERWSAVELLKHPFMGEFDDSLGKEVGESETVSPTSVLDQGGWYWNSVEESSSPVETVFPACSSSAVSDRIGKLAMFSEECSWSDDGDWITVRVDVGNDDSSAGNFTVEDDRVCCSVLVSSSGDYLDSEGLKFRCGYGYSDAANFTFCKYNLGHSNSVFRSNFERKDEMLLLAPI